MQKQINDERAAEALQAEREFCLYLRSFKIDISELSRAGSNVWRTIFLMNPITGLIYMFYAWRNPYRGTDLQRILNNLIPIPVVAIGDKVTSHGVAKQITIDADWEEVAVRMMRDSKLIIFSPYPTPGAARELDLIVELYLDKTVFLMPPSGAHRVGDFEEDWTDLRNSKGQTLELPQYSKKGLVFRMTRAADESPCSIKCCDILPFSEDNIMKSTSAILK